MSNPQVELHIAGYGVVTLELDQEKAPKTVANFLAYVQKGHYNGTIFHRVIPGFMVQGGGFEPGSFEAALADLLAAAVRARPVHFLHGNRDFLVGAAFFQRTGVTPLADPTLLDFHGQRLLLSHGDLLCLDDLEYQRFRALARTSAWQQQFLAQPLAVRRAQARGIRQESEARKRSGAVYADVDGPAALAWLQAANAPTLVHGHTHRPAEHALAPGFRRVVLSDWDAAAQPPRGDLLRLTAAGLERMRIGPM